MGPGAMFKGTAEGHGTWAIAHDIAHPGIAQRSSLQLSPPLYLSLSFSLCPSLSVPLSLSLSRPHAPSLPWSLSRVPPLSLCYKLSYPLSYPLSML